MERCPYGISDENRIRSVWNLWVMLLLLYTGVVFPFRLAFIDFGIPSKQTSGWYWWFEFLALDISFYIDLVANFFFSYREGKGREIFSLPRIAKRYLRKGFTVNLVACIPPEAFSLALCTVLASNPCTTSTVNQVGRLSRLQRMSRMTRLIRLTRLFKISGILKDSQVVKDLRSYRGVRMMNQCCGLLFVVHLMACGWWIVAALHSNIEETWLGSRQSGTDGLSIYELSEQGELGVEFQWLTAMYFTLTIFTTVGFGDMSAYTTAEMVYACIAMIAGCIVNGIILSEVISIYTSDNDEVRLLEDRRNLVRSFGKHCQVESKTTEALAQALNSSKVEANTYNREDMRMVLTSGMLPRRMLSALPGSLFSGRLVLNKFVTGPASLGLSVVPPRFPVLLGLACSSFYYDRQQAVYHVQDHAWNIYLVLYGTFSYVARSARDASSEAELARSAMRSLAFPVSLVTQEDEYSPYQLFSSRQYFGDLEIVMAARPRISTARCESTDGHVLVLHKRELFALLEEFPLMKKCWQRLAKHRSRRRDSAQRRFQHCTYKELAVRNLQRCLAYLMRRKHGTSSLAELEWAAQTVFSALSPIARAPRRHGHVEARMPGPSEVVPEYAVYLQAHMNDVQAELGDMRQSLLTITAGMRDLAAAFCGLKELLGGPAARQASGRAAQQA